MNHRGYQYSRIISRFSILWRLCPFLLCHNKNCQKVYWISWKVQRQIFF